MRAEKNPESLNKMIIYIFSRNQIVTLMNINCTQIQKAY